MRCIWSGREEFNRHVRRRRGRSLCTCIRPRRAGPNCVNSKVEGEHGRRQRERWATTSMEMADDCRSRSSGSATYAAACSESECSIWMRRRLRAGSRPKRSGGYQPTIRPTVANVCSRTRAIDPLVRAFLERLLVGLACGDHDGPRRTCVCSGGGRAVCHGSGGFEIWWTRGSIEPTRLRPPGQHAHQ